MGWSHWIYLGVGLGLGLSYSRLGAQWGNIFRSSSASQAAKLEATPDQPILEQLKAFQLAYQLADEMNQFKAGFLVRVSHELRSPLNSLISLHQLILSNLCDNPDEEREFVAQANDSALKLVKLLDEILDVARTEHGTNQLQIQTLQLALVLEEVYQLTYLLAQNRSFRLRVSPPDPKIYVKADHRWLRQVLVSLVDTSIAQMEEGSICILTKISPAFDCVYIWLDIQVSPKIWSEEAVDLLLPSCHISRSMSVNEKAAPSPGLTLLLNQTLLEFMAGRLEVLPVSKDGDESPWTRIQLAIPLVIPETAALGQEGNQA